MAQALLIPSYTFLGSESEARIEAANLTKDATVPVARYEGRVDAIVFLHYLYNTLRSLTGAGLLAGDGPKHFEGCLTWFANTYEHFDTVTAFRKGVSRDTPSGYEHFVTVAKVSESTRHLLHEQGF